MVGGTIFVALRFREKPGEPRNPKQVHGNTVLEISWTIVPALILTVMAVFTIPVIFDLAEKPTGDDVVNINVTGRQWFWEYEYTGDKFFTATEMHIPVGRPISMNVTAPPDGVIHSFWIPELNGKKDAVPGRRRVPEVRGRQARHVPRSVRRVLRPVARRHAHARDRADRGRLRRLGRVAEGAARRRAAGVRRRTTLNSQVGLHGCHSFEPVSTIETGPNLTHVGDRTTFAGGIYDDERREPHEVGAQRTEHEADRRSGGARKMPNFSTQGMTERRSQEIAEFLCNTASDPENAERCLSAPATSPGRA